MPLVQLETFGTFSAAHRMYSNKLSEKENMELYGKCYKLHGHNYRVEVRVEGEIQDDGMVINLTLLRNALQQVLDRMDHGNLEDLEYFRDKPSTAENLVVFIWDSLVLPETVRLVRLVLWETDKNRVIYRG